ncbi:hypothetical protein HFO94_13545 [Rhizobium leguminosarum]|uniref:hypothetical protein n=1 Tax=Rhizobium TaxID=379 RepID=UPI001478458E|nr:MULTISPECIES: hypothetical protein [Rhizobium]MBW8787606.1 hypothetical protein [Rhizobium leguminosarum]MBY5354546.1 hypothetical protein [Rhizobium leguminosarum]NNH44947.1 hypothetical protein [Rhizobium laguerreae]
MGKLWQRITYYRHRSELWALALAKRAPCLAIYPIGIVVLFWWVIAPLPILFPILLLQNLGKLGELMLALLAIPALVVLGFALPWFSSWCEIGTSLMFGRFMAANAKEKALTESIYAYRTRAI